MRAFLDISHYTASDKILNGRIFTCATRLYKPQIVLLFSVQKRARIRRSWPIPCKGKADSYKSLSVPGFYLGYLRGRSFPPKILLLLQYKSNYIGKLSRRDEVSAHEVSNTCLRTQLSQNAADCISAMSPDPPRSSWPSATRDFSPKWKILDKTLRSKICPDPCK